MRRESQSERAAWTALVEGTPIPKRHKYNVAAKEKRGKYASKAEADEAAKLSALERGGKIRNLREQVLIELVAGRDGVRGITWIADFVWEDNEGIHYADKKGFRTQVYKLKRRLAYLLKGITIEEI